ncbi:MAG: exosome complex RNA-binding protein Rrp4 [Nanoarchaeota archaeon]|nr:exosome complex RNA-binding protein Rrp4 [Nanoarchaeota archaeon]
MDKEVRQIVVPGETIIKGNEFLPGEGAYRDKEDVVARRFGVIDILDKHIRVIPVSGAYYPRRGNTIIGVIIDITFNGWLIDFGGAQNAFLPVSEVPRYINKNELREYLDFGESIVVKVWDVKPKGIDVSMKKRGFGQLEGGMINSVNPNKVPRIIGKEGSMVKIIKNATSCEITVGQNGKVWINGNSIEEEIATKKIIEFIVQNATVSGLTEKVEKLIKDLGMKVNSKIEIEAENTDSEVKVHDDKN